MTANQFPNDIPRPLVTLLVCAYEQEQVIKQAINSALAQTYTPLEIIFSDDASKDKTFSIIEEATNNYSGAHRIQIRRNSTNQGISAHFSLLASLSQGELLFVCAGDDLSDPLRCERIVTHWLSMNKRPDLIATDLIDIDISGKAHRVIQHCELDGLTITQWLQARPWIVGASHVWSKRLFDRFGPMRPGAHAEDQIMLLRALLAGGATTLHEPLVSWRRGGLSSKKRHANLNALLAHMYRGNQAGLAALEQQLADAQTAGLYGPVQKALSQEICRVRYIKSILEANTTQKRLQAFQLAQQVPISRRLRLLGYTLLPWLYDPFIRLKAWMRTPQRGDAAGRPAK